MAKKLTYKSSGVDVAKANSFVRGIQSDVNRTLNRSVIKRDGSFGALYRLSKEGKNNVLVSSTDGVGTKLLLAQQLNTHHTVGIDLVAMNVNDILCVGAKPLFFLDYIACGKLNPKVLTKVLKGIADGCALSGCSLIGGETAEMPGMYKPDEYDLAGFAVGVVNEKNIIDGSAIKFGNIMIGFPSSGIHSNGYSLVRKAFSPKDLKKYRKELLEPTKIYTKEVTSLIEKFNIKGIAHITGGAYYEKLTKILPKGLCFSVRKGSWPVLEIFHKLQNAGKISESQMYRTFNMGIGLVCVIDQKDQKSVENYLKKLNLQHYVMGSVINHSKQKIIFE